jgi:NADPH-dependent curcumin reductase CurA
MSTNRRFKLIRRPDGMPVDAHFALVTEETPAIGEGQFLLRNPYASPDPAMRGWMGGNVDP